MKELLYLFLILQKKAKECYNSKEYQKALNFLNDNNSERIIHIVDGLD